MTMNDYLMLKFLHIVGLAYWLGGDLGVFYSSYFVGNDNLSSEVRVAAAKILFALDQAPRICMTMMLPLGLHLAWRLDVLPINGTIMLATWAVCLGWLGMVLFLHFGTNKAAKYPVTKIDYWFRVVVVLTLAVAGIAGLSNGSLQYWVAAKLLIFAGMISCGLAVRMKLRDFGPAFARLAGGNPSAEDNAIIRRSLGGTRPFVLAIWIGLLASAALGLHLV